jgi:hypothetical protein
MRRGTGYPCLAVGAGEPTLRAWHATSP